MRVTIASRIYAPESAAAAFRLDALAQALADGGHAVKVLTAEAPPALRGAARTSDARRRSVTVRRAPVLRGADGYVRGYFQYLSFDIPLFFRLLTGRRPAVIVSEPPPTTGLVTRIAAAIRRVPYVYYAADIWSDAATAAGTPRLVTAALRCVERLALGGATRVLAVSEGVAERVRKVAPDASPIVMRNGVDTSVFTPQGPVAPLVPTAVYAGTMSEWQGADVFVRAWASVRENVPDAQLVFLGQGTARAELQELAKNLGVSDSVSFSDAVPPEVAARWLRSARVGLASIKPEIGYDFAIPTKLFASAACGTPVLFAGEGDAASIVRRESLGTVAAFDAADVAEKLSAALADVPDAESRRRLGERTDSIASLHSAAQATAAVVASSGRIDARYPQNGF